MYDAANAYRLCEPERSVAGGLCAFTATALETVRVGFQQSGTVQWELQLMQELGLAEREGVRLELVPLATKDATHIALQGGAVDVVVDDWLWVSRARDEGRPYTCVTHSLAAAETADRILVLDGRSLRPLDTAAAPAPPAPRDAAAIVAA